MRGEDLELRVIVAAPEGAERLALSFADPTLRGASACPVRRLDLRARRDGDRLRPRDRPPAPARSGAAARGARLGGGAGRRRRPRDGRERAPDSGRGDPAPAAGVRRRAEPPPAPLAGAQRDHPPLPGGLRRAGGRGDVRRRRIFSAPASRSTGRGSDFYINGVRWKGKEIPELPLIQPEKAAAMPLEILFTKEYRYALRGTDTVDGRDCWVVEFEPAVPVEGRTLFRGAVWIDREVNARVRTRAVQVGLDRRGALQRRDPRVLADRRRRRTGRVGRARSLRAAAAHHRDSSSSPSSTPPPWSSARSA